MKTGFLVVLLMGFFIAGNSVFAEGKTAGESAKAAGQSVSDTAKEVEAERQWETVSKRPQRMLVKGSRRGLKAPENRLFCTRSLVDRERKFAFGHTEKGH